VQTLIPNCCFENAFLTYFGIDICEQNFHVAFREFNEYTLYFITVI
jgi:hypothetical protein